MRALAAWSIVAVVATVLAVAPAGAVPDGYEPAPCITDGGGPTPYTDLRAGAFYLAAVEWAHANAIITPADRFNPDRSITRAEFAAMLHRSRCEPAPTTTSSFTDLRPGGFYLTAVDWLAEAGYTTGIAPGLFGPERLMTRAEFATFLFRLTGEPAGAPSAGFTDVARGRWFSSAIDWLLLEGLTTGIAPCLFGPDRFITRAEAVTFLYRFNTSTGSLAHFITLLCGLDRPTALVQNPATGTWFIAEKGGTLVRWAGGAPSDALTVPVSGGSEQGLLGVAIPADGSHVYVSYTDSAGDSRVVEYALAGDTVDVGSRREILAIDQRRSNHNGGHVMFGPDGLLYVGLGDSGGAGDPDRDAQNINTLLGSILRIDPSAPAGGKAYGIPLGNPFALGAGKAEIWLYGVRNPWKFSFDRDTDALWVADVGQNTKEEITRLEGPAFGGGANLGWPYWEGTHLYGNGPAPADHVGPVHQYGPLGQQSITGGFVYRGDAIPALDGRYLYGDFFGADLMAWSDDGGVSNLTVTALGGRPTAFAEDGSGEVYLVTFDGQVRKLVPR